MQIHRVGYGIRGFCRVAHLGLTSGMKHPTTEKRERILSFWRKHGIPATCEAFAVSRRTLFRWQAKQTSTGSVAPGNTAPKKRRQRLWNSQTLKHIKQLRAQHPNLGKNKLHPLLKDFCSQHKLPCPSVSTIGRLIADAPDKMRRIPLRLGPRGQPKLVRRARQKARKPKGVRPKMPGEVVAVDTIVRVQGSLRRYLFTLTDVETRMSFAFASTSPTSRQAKKFFCLAQKLFPGKVLRVLSDNGSEFEGEFAQYLDQEKIPRWYTYPKTPKMNAHAERFNRTVQEEFVDYHEDLLFTDAVAFNDQLAGWLIWFNTKRPHHSLKYLSPLQYIAKQHPQKCHSGWTHT